MIIDVASKSEFPCVFRKKSSIGKLLLYDICVLVSIEPNHNRPIGLEVPHRPWAFYVRAMIPGIGREAKPRELLT